MDKVYGWWNGGWMRRVDGSVIHSPYPQVVAAEKGANQFGEVCEILPDGEHGEIVYAKAVRPQSDKAIRFREDK